MLRRQPGLSIAVATAFLAAINSLLAATNFLLNARDLDGVHARLGLASTRRFAQSVIAFDFCCLFVLSLYIIRARLWIKGGRDADLRQRNHSSFRRTRSAPR